MMSVLFFLHQTIETNARGFFMVIILSTAGVGPNHIPHSIQLTSEVANKLGAH